MICVTHLTRLCATVWVMKQKTEQQQQIIWSIHFEPRKNGENINISFISASSFCVEP